MSEPLTLCQASRRIDPSGQTLDRRGRKLGRLIEAAEKKHRRTIGIVLQGKHYRRRKVTLGQLRHFLPELFSESSVDALHASLKGYLAGIDQRISERCAETIARDVEPRLGELWERDEKLAKSVMELAVRVSALASE